jgi:hypothetical protein
LRFFPILLIHTEKNLNEIYFIFLKYFRGFPRLNRFDLFDVRRTQHLFDAILSNRLKILSVRSNPRFDLNFFPNYFPDLCI